MGELSKPDFLPPESLPLGFRFHPRDVELINHYLKRRINGQISPTDSAVIPDVDVCRFEPWDLPDRSNIRSSDPEWFFFAPSDRKYRSGSQSNRATAAGYWKATGKDRFVRARGKVVVGMKKTLVFHRGRAPKGTRTGWIMHEYRTVEPEFESGDQGSFVLCRLFRKPEEKILSSSIEETEGKCFSPALSRHSPEDRVHGSTAMEESETPRNQASPDSYILADAVDNQPTHCETGLADRPDILISSSLKQEESHCNSNITLDVDDLNVEMTNEEGDNGTPDIMEPRPLSPMQFSIESSTMPHRQATTAPRSCQCTENSRLHMKNLTLELRIGELRAEMEQLQVRTSRLEGEVVELKNKLWKERIRNSRSRDCSHRVLQEICKSVSEYPCLDDNYRSYAYQLIEDKKAALDTYLECEWL